MPLDHIFLNPNLFLSNIIGRLASIPNAIKEYESVVNLEMPHSEEAKAKLDKSIKLMIYLNIIKLFIINLITY